MNNESTLTHSSVIAKSKLSIKPSIFHKDAASLEPQSSAKTAFQCQHTSALSSSHILKKEGLIEELSQSPVEKGTELSVHNFTNDSTYSIKYPAPFNNTAHSEILHKEAGMNDIVSIPASEKNVYEDGISSVNRHLQSRKFTSIRKEKDAASFLHLNRHGSEGTLDRTHRNFAELSNNKTKKTADTSDKCNIPPSSFAHAALTDNCDRTVDVDINEGSLNKMKVRYEEFQEHKAEVTSVNQQATHYKFFPSVVLSNCLNRPQKASAMSCKIQKPKKPSRLKLSKKMKSSVNKEQINVGGEMERLEDKIQDNKSDLKQDLQHSIKQDIADSTDAQGSDILDKIELVKDSSYAPGNACSKSPPDVDRVPSCDIAVMMEDGAFQGNTCEMNSFECQFEEGNADSDPSSALYGNKYTLRAKRKVNFESEDGEASLGASNSKLNSNLPQPVEANEYASNPQKSRKRRKVSNKLPPVIIKYIIINRFKGRKNMKVKLEKIDPSEDCVTLTEEKLKFYDKMAPLKDFWPKVPDSPATKYPLYPVVPKKNSKRKTKPKSTKKKPGKVPKTESHKLSRPLPPRRRKPCAFLVPPMPSYSVETEDCDTDYKDVMSKLGFLTERSPSPIHMSPPRCWSPTDPQAEELKRSHVEETSLFKTYSLVMGREEGDVCPKKRQRRAQTNKTKRKSPLSSPTVKRQGNKINQLELVKDSKRQKGKPRQKKCEKAPRKHTKIKDRGKKTVNEKKAGSEPLIQDQNGTQVGETTKSESDFPSSDLTLSGFSTGHVYSTQVPSSYKQENLQESIQSSVSTIPSSSQNHVIVQKEISVSSSPLPLNQGIESFKMNNAKAPVPNVFQTNNTTQKITPTSVIRPAQVIQSTQFKCAPFTQEEDPTEVQKRLLASVVKLRDSQTVPDAMLFEKLQSKLLPCTMNSQQQVTSNQDLSKQSDLNSSSESHLARSSLVTSLRSPIKMSTWDQKGDLFDGTQFTPHKFNQNCLPDIFSCTKTLQNTIKTSDSQGVLNTHCGIAVLKELLHKKQGKEKANASEESSPKVKGGQSQTELKCTNKKSQCPTPNRKPRAPRNTKPKAPKNLKTLPAKYHADRHVKSSASDGSPAMFADPGFESCYSLEDSLSPEHNYNFDINAVGQTGLCSLYTGSQFIAADQNLPQKFLSDPFPASATENERIKQENTHVENTNVHSASDQKVLLRPSSLSPDMFEKSSIDNKQSALVNKLQNGLLVPRFPHPPPVFSQHSEDLENNKSRPGSQELFRNACFTAAQSAWIHTDVSNKTKDAALNACIQSISSSSFTGLASSPEIDFMDGDLELYISRHSGGLTPTPDSSPRSMSSPSQSKNGSGTPRPVHILKPLMSPPSREEIMATLMDHDLMETIYQEPFFSNPSDAPEKPRWASHIT